MKSVSYRYRLQGHRKRTCWDPGFDAAFGAKPGDYGTDPDTVERPEADVDSLTPQGFLCREPSRSDPATGTAAAYELRAKRASLRDGCERPFEDEIRG